MIVTVAFIFSSTAFAYLSWTLITISLFFFNRVGFFWHIFANINICIYRCQDKICDCFWYDSNCCFHNRSFINPCNPLYYFLKYITTRTNYQSSFSIVKIQVSLPCFVACGCRLFTISSTACRYSWSLFSASRTHASPPTSSFSWSLFRHELKTRCLAAICISLSSY
jgi:hypothetical protein